MVRTRLRPRGSQLGHSRRCRHRWRRCRSAACLHLLTLPWPGHMGRELWTLTPWIEWMVSWMSSLTHTLRKPRQAGLAAPPALRPRAHCLPALCPPILISASFRHSFCLPQARMHGIDLDFTFACSPPAHQANDYGPAVLASCPPGGSLLALFRADGQYVAHGSEQHPWACMREQLVPRHHGAASPAQMCPRRCSRASHPGGLTEAGSACPHPTHHFTRTYSNVGCNLQR